jgi:zinc transport system substrate-binding protein
MLGIILKNGLDELLLPPARFLRTGAALALCALALAGCGSGQPSRDPDGVEVIASFSPLAEAAERVGGGLVEVRNLTPAGVEPHDLELTPDDVATISDADVVVYLGGGFQPAIEEALSEARGAVLVDVLDVARPVEAASTEDHGDASVDPHVWLDPLRFADVVRSVEAALSRADPGHASAFAANADAYVDELLGIDRSVRDGLADCERSTIVTSHDAFAYLAAAYALDLVPITGLSPESEPDARRLAELVDLVEREDATTIFTEPLVSSAVAETVAREAGADVEVLDPIESYTDEQVAAGESYATLMRANLDALRGALGCG